MVEVFDNLYLQYCSTVHQRADIRTCCPSMSRRKRWAKVALDQENAFHTTKIVHEVYSDLQHRIDTGAIFGLSDKRNMNKIIIQLRLILQWYNDDHRRRTRRWRRPQAVRFGRRSRCPFGRQRDSKHQRHGRTVQHVIAICVASPSSRTPQTPHNRDRETSRTCC